MEFIVQRLGCDHFQKVLDLHPVIATSPKPRRYGWRWCKWGEYIGDYTPDHEYLYDEEGIEEVFVYQIIRIK